MDKTLYPTSNRAEGTLLADINASQLTVVLNAGDGAKFPTGSNGTANSAGTANTLNSTGIGSSAIAVGDFIRNVTDGSYAVVLTKAADVITTTDLQGGTDNTWEDADEFAVGSFVISVNNRDASGNVTKIELMKVKYCNNSANTLYIDTGGRGFGGTSAQSFTSATHYASLFVTADTINAMQDIAAENINIIDELKNRDVNIKGIKTHAVPPRASVDPADDNDLTRKSWVAALVAGASSAGQTTLPAGDTIAVNKPVYVDDNGKWQEASGASESREAMAGTCTWGGALVELTPDKYLHVRTGSNIMYFRVVEYDIATDTWTQHTELSSSLITSNYWAVFTSKISDTKVRVLAYQTQTASNAKWHGHTINIDLTANTVAIAANVNGTAGMFVDQSSHNETSVAVTGDGSFMFAPARAYEGSTRKFAVMSWVGDSFLFSKQQDLTRFPNKGTTTATQYSVYGCYPIGDDMIAFGIRNLDSTVTGRLVVWQLGVGVVDEVLYTTTTTVGCAPIRANGDHLVYVSTGADEVRNINPTTGAIGSVIMNTTGTTPVTSGRSMGRLFQDELFVTFVNDNVYFYRLIGDELIRTIQGPWGAGTSNYFVNSAMYYHCNIIMKSLHEYLVSRQYSGSDMMFRVNDTRLHAIGITRESKVLDEDLVATTVGGVHDTETGLSSGNAYGAKGATFGVAISATKALITRVWEGMTDT